MDEPTDAELVTRSRAGQRAAFDQLAQRHRPRIVRLAASLIGDADEADSVGQEALARALERLPEFDTERPFGPWLQGIAVNVCRTYLRDRSRRARSLAPEQLAETAAPEGRRQGVLSDVLRREAGHHTLLAVGQLPLPLREAFVLHFLEGLAYAEIAEITGIAAGTLRVRAHRARTLLRHSLGSVVDTWLRETRDEDEA